MNVISTGAFHAAVEIHGKEWSFGATPDNRSGIFSCPPRACSAHSFREAIPMGEVALSEEAVKAVSRAHLCYNVTPASESNFVS
eukprot:2509059-Amphidinium_carterae.1